MAPHPIPALKMHSLRNTILVIPPNGDRSWDSNSIIAISDLHTGIGADQVMVCRPLNSVALNQDPSITRPSMAVDIWNRDGSVAIACGNGMRCVLASFNTEIDEVVTLYGPAGPVQGWKTLDQSIAIAQGAVTIGFNPSSTESQESCLPKTTFWIESLNQSITGVPAHIGNPHAIVLAPPPDHLPATWLAFNDHFPHGVNLSFVWPTSEDRGQDGAPDENLHHYSGNTFYVKTWERGVGLTQGCGSASCAVGAVLWSIQKQTFLLQHNNPKYTLIMPGGTMHLWHQDACWIHCAPAHLIAQCHWWGQKE